MIARPAAVALLLGACACDTSQTWVTPDPHLERMLEQSHVRAYDEPMRAPPPGVVPVDRTIGQPLALRGKIDGHYADSIPIPVTRGLVETGRARFDTFCAACHGLVGDGKSLVALAMQQRRPRSLHDDEVRGYPPGKIYERIAEGYGLMPSYAVQLDVEERWAVVAYVRALQISRHVEVARLSSSMRRELAREAP